MRNYIELGPVPCDEECQQVGTPHYDHAKAIAECGRYLQGLQRAFPQGIFRIKSFPHDYGSYLEVVAMYTEEDLLAYEIEGSLPATWKELDKMPVRMFRKCKACGCLYSAKGGQDHCADCMQEGRHLNSGESIF